MANISWLTVIQRIGFVTALGAAIALSSCDFGTSPPPGKYKYQVDFLVSPEVETDDPNQIVMLGHVGTPIGGTISATAGWLSANDPSSGQYQNELTSPAYALFQPVKGTQYADMPYAPGDIDDPDALDGVRIVSSGEDGILSGTPKVAGVYSFLPAVHDTFYNDTYKPFNGPDRYASNFSLKTSGDTTWLVSRRSITLLILPEILITNKDRYRMRCEFNNGYIGTISMTVDYGTNYVEVSGYNSTEIVGLFRLNVVSKTLVKWTRLPRKAFPAEFGKTWGYNQDEQSSVDQVALDLNTGELSVDFAHGALMWPTGARHGVEFAHCTAS